MDNVTANKLIYGVVKINLNTFSSSQLRHMKGTKLETQFGISLMCIYIRNSQGFTY